MSRSEEVRMMAIEAGLIAPNQGLTAQDIEADTKLQGFALIAEIRAEMLTEQEVLGAWDANLTSAERSAAVAEEIRATAAGERRGTQEDSWSDPRTANLLGNYVTR